MEEETLDQVDPIGSLEPNDTGYAGESEWSDELQQDKRPGTREVGIHESQVASNLQSLVEWNLTENSPVAKFFGQFEQNAQDPFAAARNQVHGFIERQDSLQEATARQGFGIIRESQAARLTPSLDTYRDRAERLTQNYRTPEGFYPRANERDYYNLLAGDSAAGQGLRASFFQLQETTVLSGLTGRVEGIGSRTFGRTEIVSQSFSQNLQGSYSGSDNLKSLNQTAGILLGNEVSKSVFDTVVQRQGSQDSFMLASMDYSMHPKVGYLYGDSGDATVGFIGSQNITSALSKGNTADELLVIRAKPGDSATSAILQQLKDATDSILEVTAAQHSAMITGQHPLNIDFRQAVKETFLSKGNYADYSARSLRINEEFQYGLRDALRAVERSDQKYAVVTSQYVESLFRTSSSQDAGFSRWKSEMLTSLKNLAGTGRLRISITGTNFNPSQGLYSLLDDLYADKLPQQGRETLTALLDANAFVVVPTQYLHSKGWGVFNKGLDSLSLDEYAIGSGHTTENSIRNNLEMGLVLKGLGSPESRESGGPIRNLNQLQTYMLESMAGGFRSDRNGTAASSRGQSAQVNKAMALLEQMGGVQARSLQSQPEAPFVFAPQYKVGSGKVEDGLASGIDIQIRNPLGDGSYSFGVSIAQQYSHLKKDYVPVLYLSKTNQVVTGMVYKNDTPYRLQSADGRAVGPGETVELDAIETLGGMVATMRHAMGHDVRNRALLKTTEGLLQNSRGFQGPITNILTDSVRSAAQSYLGGNRLLNYSGRDLGKFVQYLGSIGIGPKDLSSILASAANKLDGRNSGEIARLFSHYNNAVAKGQAITGARTLVDNLWNQARSSLLQGETQYQDLLIAMVQQDNSGLREIYEQELKSGRREAFSAMVDGFQPQHVLGYSGGQELYKKQVFGMDLRFFESLGIAAEGGVAKLPGFMLNPYILKHGEPLGSPGEYLRGLTSTARPVSSDLSRAIGGVYKMSKGAAKVQNTEGILGTMPGLAMVTGRQYREEARRLGLQDDLIEEMAQEFFTLPNLRPGTREVMYLFPFAKAEQISQRLKNMSSARPLLDISKDLMQYAGSLGTEGSRNFGMESMLSGEIMSSLPVHQWEYLRKVLQEEPDYRAAITRLRREKGDLLQITQGIIGGAAPRNILINTGPSQLSDFGLYNAGLNETLKYGSVHPLSQTFLTRDINGSAPEFGAQLQQRLKEGTLFFGQDLEIRNGTLLDFLTRQYGKRLEQSGVDQSARVLQEMRQDYPGINARMVDGELNFSFKRGVYSPGDRPGALQGDEGLDAQLRSTRKIGSIQDGDAAFAINDMYTYRDVGGGRLRKEAVKIKAPAFSRRAYNAVTVLAGPLRVNSYGGSTIGVEAPLMTIQDFMSGLRPGLQGNKGPWLGVMQQFFDFLDTQVPQGYLPDRVAQQQTFAMIGPSQIKGFMFDAGLTLLDNPQGGIRRELAGSSSGIRVAESLALLMLGEGKVADALSRHLVNTNRSQFGNAVSTLAASMGDKFASLGTLGRKQDDSIKQSIKPSFAAYPAFMTLVDEQYRDLGLQRGLIKTVEEALRKPQGSVAQTLGRSTRDLVESTVKQYRVPELVGVLDRDVIQESWATRPAAAIAFLMQASQDLYQDVDIDARLGAKGFDELSLAPTESLFSKAAAQDRVVRTELIDLMQRHGFKSLERDKVLKSGTEAEMRSMFERFASPQSIEEARKHPAGYYSTRDIYLNEQRLPQFEGLYTAVRAKALGMRVALPSQEQYWGASQKEREQLDEELRLGLLAMRSQIQTARMIRMPEEMAPSKIQVSTGMQDSSALEAQYGMVLTQQQLDLFTHNPKEQQQVRPIQETLLVLAAMMEGGLPGPQQARSLYRLQNLNLAYMGVTSQDARLNDRIHRRNRALDARTAFSAAYSSFSQKALPDIYRAQGVKAVRTPAELALDQYLERGSVLNPDGSILSQFREMSRFADFASGPVVPAGLDPQEEMDYRLSLFEPYVRGQFDSQKSPRTMAAVRSILMRANQIKVRVSSGYSVNGLAWEDAKGMSKQEIWNRSVDLATRENKTLNLSAKQKTLNLSAEEKTVYAGLAKTLLSDRNYNYDRMGSLMQDRSRFTRALETAVMGEEGLGPYRSELENRIRSAQDSSANQYIEGLEIQRSWAQQRIRAGGSQAAIDRAQQHLESVNQTVRIVLPALERSEVMADGRIRAYWASSDVKPPTQGLLLGLDVLQKMSLTFQGVSHAALKNQERLSIELADATKLIQRVTRDMLQNKGPSLLTSAEFDQLNQLRLTIHEATESAQSLANNQESIRKAMGDRLKQKGASYIAMSSLLVQPNQVVVGSRVVYVIGLKTGAGLNTLALAMRERLKSLSEDVHSEQTSKFFETTADTLRSFAESLGLSREKIEGITASTLHNKLVDLNTRRVIGGEDFKRQILQTISGRDFADLSPRQLTAAREAIEYQLFGSAMVKRQGGPGGGGQFDQEMSQVIGLKDLEATQALVNTFIVPADSTAATLALVPAVGHQFMQLGDYDGDSFQVAISQLASVTQQVSESMLKSSETRDKIRRIKKTLGTRKQEERMQARARPEDAMDRGSLTKDKIHLEQQLGKLEEELQVYQSDLLVKMAARNKLDKAAQSRMREGLKRYTTDIMGLPEEVVTHVFKTDEERQGLVKQYRDTMAGHYAAGPYQDYGVQPSEFSKVASFGMQDGKVVAQMQPGTEASVGTEIDRLIAQSVEPGHEERFLGLSRQEQLDSLVRYQGAITSAQVSYGMMKKLTAGIEGSQLDPMALHGLQSVMGTTGTSMLGPTYNAIIPLMTLMQRDVAAERLRESDQYDHYRSVLAESIDAVIKGSDIGNQKVAEVLRQHVDSLRGERGSKEIPLSIRVEQRRSRTAASYKLQVAVQQFLRDDALKPKAGAKGVWEAMESFTLTREQKIEMGLEGLQGAETRGLSSILQVVPENSRERVMQQFLGLHAGNSLQFMYGVKDNVDNYDTRHLMGFAALQLATEFLGGKFTAAEMVEGNASTLSSSLRSIYRQQAQGSRAVGVEDFMFKVTADALAKFSTEWVHGSLLEAGDRGEFYDKALGIQQLYGIGQDERGRVAKIDSLAQEFEHNLRSRTPDANDELIRGEVERHRVELQERQTAIIDAIEQQKAVAQLDGRGLTRQEEFTTMIRALTEVKDQQDMAALLPRLQELRQVNVAIGEIRKDKGLSNLQQSLDVQLSAIGLMQQRGQVDAALMPEIYGRMLHDIARDSRTELYGETASRQGIAAMHALGGALMPEFETSGLSPQEQQEAKRLMFNAHVRAQRGVSAAEIAAQHSASVGALQRLQSEQIELVEQQRQIIRQEREGSKLELQQIGNRLNEVGRLMHDFETAGVGLVDLKGEDSQIELSRQIAAMQAKEDVYRTYHRREAPEVNRARVLRRQHNSSELVGLAAVPVIFGLMSGTIPVGEKIQEIGLNFLQSALTATTYENSVVGAHVKGNAADAVDIQKQLGRTAQTLQRVRIQQFLRDSTANPIEAAGRAVAFEAIYQASSIGASILTEKFLGKAAGGGVGRGVTEILGGVVGMAIAGAITKRPITSTEIGVDDFLERSLQSIRMSVREASERFLQAMINQQSVEAYDQDAGESIESSMQEGSGAPSAGDPSAIGGNDLNWYLGITVLDQDGDEMPQE